MLNNLTRPANRRNVRFAFTVALALMIIGLLSEYRGYAYAVAWHCVHGNSAEIGGHTVSLPLLWWKESAHARDTPDMQDHDEWLERACPSRLFDLPEIDFSKAIPGEVADIDAEELDLTQKVIVSLNKDPAMGWSHSLVVLKASKLTFYCQQDHANYHGLELYNGLWCHSVKLPYSLRYSGPREHEEDAMAIFMSLQ